MRLDNIYAAVLQGQAPAAARETTVALSENFSPEDILYQACVPAMTEVGRQFEVGEKFVPEMLISARAMQASVNILRPRLVQHESRLLGRVVLGTVAGDLHDIGKNLVGMMLEGVGFEIIDLGTDVAGDQFVAAITRYQPDIIGMSALLTTTMASVTGVIDALVEAGVRDRVKIMIGGAPITQEFADKVGADAFAADAGSACRVAKNLLAVG